MMRNMLVKAAFLSACCTQAAAAQDGNRAADDLEQAFGTNESISLATGYERPLLAAPATATVVNRDEIDRLGATTLKQILNRVPGFHISTPDNRGYTELVRGLDTRVLVLLNGIPVQNGFVVSYQDLDDFLLEDVERIEIVRGPASALYGADSDGGVVNVITRTAARRSDTEVGLQGGEFATYGGWIRSGTDLSRVHVNGYVGYRSSDMTDARVRADRQSGIDSLLGTRASLAPGEVNAQRNVVNARVIASLDAWRFTANYAEETNYGTGVGLALSLDPSGKFDNYVQSYDLAYNPDATSDWTPRGYVSYVNVSNEARLVRFFPPGAFGGAFPDGVLQSVRAHENRVRAEVSELYSGLPLHTIRVGLGALRATFSPDFDARNFVVRRGRILPTGTFAPGAGVNDSPVVGAGRNDVYYAYGQDEWNFIPDWQLTYGIRGDHYSGFGAVVNPRIGLVWAVRQDISIKWLYGTAFKPPGLTECCSNGTFGGLGNRGLDPQRLSMGEWTIQYQGSRFEGQLALYGYKQTDIISPVRDAQSPNGLGFRNVGKRSGRGGEIEWRWAITPSLSFSGGYAYQNLFGDDVQTGTQFAAPKHQVTTELSWVIFKDVTLNLNSLTIAGRQRDLNDPRPQVADYSSFGVSARWKNLAQLVDVSLSAFNVLDEDIREPSLSADALPNDLEQPGRQIFLQVARSF
jgi:iron complex outermembrane receptor protein